jgi:hypothetical protein
VGGDVVEALLDIDEGPNKMGLDLAVLTGPQDIVEELLALFLRPAVGALVDRDDELLRPS